MFQLDGYTIDARLGAGAQGETFGGVEVATGRRVAIKRMRMSDVPDWKAVELFEREGRTLAGLNHPGIANQLAAVARPSPEGGEDFFLIQERIEGESLDRAVERGEVWSPDAVRVFLESLGATLSWLHQRNPPVIHRDLKPSNIMRRASPDAGASPYVVIDFGALQVMVPTVREDGGSTIVGTSGYMPPEQLLGRTGPASDLYALGATAVHLLTGEHPSRLPLERLRIDWRSGLPRGVVIPQALGGTLDRLLAPAVEDRFGSAKELLDALKAPPAKSLPVRPKPPPHPLVMAAVVLFAILFIVGVAFSFADSKPQSLPSGSYVPDLIPELQYTPTLPVSVAVDPRLARVLGPEKTAEVTSKLQFTPRAWDGATAGEYVAASLLVQWSGEGAIGNVKARWKLVDEDGDVLAAEEGDVVASFEAPLHPGDIKGIAARLHAPKREGATTLVAEIMSLERVSPLPTLGTPLDVAWNTPQPDGVSLKFTLASLDEEVSNFGDSRRNLPRIILENTGSLPLVMLRMNKQLDAPDGSVPPKDHSVWVIAYGEPSLLPGERRVFSAWSSENAALSSWRMSVAELRTGHTRKVP